MGDSSFDKYSAGEQSLGYLYQSRLALLRLLELAEATSVILEKDDDVDLVDAEGKKSLLSLKHKARGDRLTDLSADFWKSVRIWLVRYTGGGRITSNLRFFLFTTATVSDTSFLRRFLPVLNYGDDETKSLGELAVEALGRSKSEFIGTIGKELGQLTRAEREDFLSRILIFDDGPRIEDVPHVIKDRYLRSIRREYRTAVYERVEGWWNDEIIKRLTGKTNEGIFGYEVSDKLAALSEEYRADNLPITFRGKQPSDQIDTESDPRVFVSQLREIGVSSNRIRNAILDYYRAFQQRSEWARENLLVSGEIESFEDRLVDEWSRYRDVVFEQLDENSAEDVMQEAGKELYNWADQQSGNIEALRIRARVSEPYVIRGSYHILADSAPKPRVYWHPMFLERVAKVLAIAK